MKITIESTDTGFMYNGTPTRLWTGTTDTGVPIFVLSARIGSDEPLPQSPAPLPDNLPNYPDVQNITVGELVELAKQRPI